jgi:hypothetical protein
MTPAAITYERYVASLWDEDEDRQVCHCATSLSLIPSSMAHWLQIYVDRACPPDAPTRSGSIPLTLELVDTSRIPGLSSNHQRLCDYVITYHKESLHDLRIQWPISLGRYGTRHDETDANRRPPI